MSAGHWQSLGWLCAALWLAGCGGKASTVERDSGNTNWLTACETDLDCGTLACSCGKCQTACDGAATCGSEPEAACRGDASDATGVEAPQLELEHSDPDAFAADLKVTPDGAFVLVGGQGRYVFEQLAQYRNFWLSKLDAAGNTLWQVSEPRPDTTSNGRSVAITKAGDIVALSTLFNGEDQPVLQRYDSEGTALGSVHSAPGFTSLRAAEDGGVFAAGSQLVEFRDGRPFTAAWSGRLAPDLTTITWEQPRVGLDGSVSNAVGLDVDADGNALVAGSLGSAPDSNESAPWAGKLDPQGNWLWQRTMAVVDPQHCDAGAVALTPEGDALVAGNCAGNWLHAYDAAGQLRWQRHFPVSVTALAALPDAGYAVGLGTLEPTLVGAPHAQLLRFDAQQRLRWRTERPNCFAFKRLIADEAGIVALAMCQEGFELLRYAER